MLLVKESREVPVALAKSIFQLVNAEMQQGNLAHKKLEEILDELTSNKSLVAFWEDQLVGYVCYRDWGIVIELMTIYVKNDFRKKGIGSQLAKAIFEKAKKESNGKKIVALVNINSGGIMQKLGFVHRDNAKIPIILRQACIGCYQENEFPNCHCQFVENINT